MKDLERTIGQNGGRKASEQERNRRNKAVRSERRAEAARIFQMLSAGVVHVGHSVGELGQFVGHHLGKEASGVCFSAKRERHSRREWVGPGKHNPETRQRIISASMNGRMQTSR